VTPLGELALGPSPSFAAVMTARRRLLMSNVAGTDRSAAAGGREQVVLPAVVADFALPSLSATHSGSRGGTPRTSRPQ